MSDPLTMPFVDTQAIRRPALGRAIVSGEVRNSDMIRQIRALSADNVPTQATAADTLGRPPKPTLYKPTRWQKVRDTVFPCCKPPRVLPLTEAKRARPPSRFFGNYELNPVAPEPEPAAVAPGNSKLPGRKPTFLEEFKTPKVDLPATPAPSPEPAAVPTPALNIDKDWRTK